MAQVLVVEDDPQIRRALGEALERAGHQVRLAADGGVALPELVGNPPDLVVLDLGLPDVDGSTLLTMIRSIGDTAVLIVTARTEPDEIIRLLNLGADDYITKPFEFDQLLARINAILRRVGPVRRRDTHLSITIGGLELDVRNRSLKLSGQRIELRHLEYELLLTLALADSQLVPTEALIRQLWGGDVSPADAAGRLDAQLSLLRAKLGETARSPRYLHRVRNVGVRLVDLGQG